MSECIKSVVVARVRYYNESQERARGGCKSPVESESKSDWLMNIKFGPQLLSAL